MICDPNLLKCPTRFTEAVPEVFGRLLGIDGSQTLPYDSLKHLSTLKTRTNHLSVQTVKKIIENGLVNPNSNSVTIHSLDYAEIFAFLKERKQAYHAALAAAQEATGQGQNAEDARFKWKLTQTQTVFSFAKK